MSRQVFLFSPIYDGTAESIIGQLLDLDRENNEEITMLINSPGGSVTSMFAIIDIMQAVKSKIRTIVTGQAASAASVIAAMGDKRLMTENARFMIHEVWTLMIGSVSEIEDDLKEMTKEQEKLLKLLSKKTNKTVDQIKAMIKKKNKFMDAKESKRFGLVDEIIKPNSAQILKLSESINVEGYEIDEVHSEVQLLREGEFVHPDYGTLNIDKDILSQMVDNFDNKIRGIEIAIDYTHDNETGESPAACWIKSLEVRDTDNGSALFAKVEFTPKGKELVQEKEYKYASADFAINYATESGEHIPYVLRGGTLTNRPFIKEMNPIKLSEKNKQTKEIKLMDKETMMNALKDKFQVDVVSMQASIESQKSEIESLENNIKELGKLPAVKEEEIQNLKQSIVEMTNEIDAKEKEIAQKEKVSAYDSLVNERKVLPAQKDKILETFDSAEKMLNFYKDAPAVVKKEVKGSDNLDGDGLTAREDALIKAGVLKKEDVIKYGNK